jgi:hypothetical protein
MATSDFFSSKYEDSWTCPHTLRTGLFFVATVQKFEKTKNTATTVQKFFSFPKKCRGFHFVVPITTLESLAFSSGF